MDHDDDDHHSMYYDNDHNSDHDNIHDSDHDNIHDNDHDDHEDHSLRSQVAKSLYIEVNVPLFVTHAIIAFFVIIANLLLILVFARTRSLRNVSSLIMISLACSDLGVGILTLTPLFYAAFSQTMNHTHCDVLGFFFSVFWMGSLYTILLLSLDRLVAIVNPFRYGSICRWGVCIASIIAIWIFSMSLWSFTLAGFGGFYYSPEKIMCVFDSMRFPIIWISFTIMIFVPPTLITGACYYRIWTISHWHTQKLQALSPSTSTSTPKKPLHISFQAPPPSSQSRRAACTVLIIMGVFYASWLPFVCDNLREAFTGEHNHGLGHDHMDWPHTVMHLLAITNSLWNPIIYMVTNRRVRKASLRVLATCCPLHIRARYFERSMSGSYSFSFSRSPSVRSKVTFIQTP